MKEKLGNLLADYYLDRDSTNVSDYQASQARAKLMLDIDPDNTKTRCFLLRLNTHQVEDRQKNGERNYPNLYQQLNELRRDAEWLEQKLSGMSEERRSQVKIDLAGYYEQMGLINHSQGRRTVSEITEGKGHYQITQILRRIKESYLASDVDLKKSLQFDPVNPRLQMILELHREEYQEINRLL